MNAQRRWQARGADAYPGGGGGGGKAAGQGGHGKGGSKGSKGSKGGKGAGGGGQKPTDDPQFVVWSEGMRLEGSSTGASYVVDAYVASGTFSRVFRVHRDGGGAPAEEGAPRKRWRQPSKAAAPTGEDEVDKEPKVFAAKVMRKTDEYIQYSSDAQKEGRVLQNLEKAQRDAGKDVLTMMCFDSFATCDDTGEEYWCLILEWMEVSLFDVVKANRNMGLHLSMVQPLAMQLLRQLKELQVLECTHTDIKHKNCCLADAEYYLAAAADSGRQQQLILTRPLAKFIDYGNAAFEGERKTHPIHTKQFRAPEVLLNVQAGWGPPSDMWTLGVTLAFLVSGRLLFNSHEPNALLRLMVQALGPFPEKFCATARDSRARRAAEEAARSNEFSSPQLGDWLGLDVDAGGDAGRECVDLLARMLAPDPADRITPLEALEHPFLAADVPTPPRPAGSEVRGLGASGRGAHDAGDAGGKGGGGKGYGNKRSKGSEGGKPAWSDGGGKKGGSRR